MQCGAGCLDTFAFLCQCFCRLVAHSSAPPHRSHLTVPCRQVNLTTAWHLGFAAPFFSGTSTPSWAFDRKPTGHLKRSFWSCTETKNTPHPKSNMASLVTPTGAMFVDPDGVRRFFFGFLLPSTKLPFAENNMFGCPFGFKGNRFTTGNMFILSRGLKHMEAKKGAWLLLGSTLRFCMLWFSG